jgi:hypothetical protein
VTIRILIRRSWITLASLSLLLVATACGGGDQPSSAPTTSASAPASQPASTAATPSENATTEQPVPVFPQPDADSPLVKKNGKLSCDPGDPAQKLKLDSSIKAGDETIATSVDGDRLTVTITPQNVGQTYGYVNDTLPILLAPPEPDSLPFSAFYMDQEDFGGKITSIVLCGGAKN